MRRSLAVPATLVNSMLTLAPQLLALVVLGPSDFGRFSIVYLLFAWGASLQMSLVCEPVGRGHRHGERGGGDVTYRAVATYVACGAGLLAGAVSYLLWSRAPLAVVLGVAAAAACFRVPARYATLLDADWRAALLVDVMACAGLVTGGATALLLGAAAIDIVGWAWAAAMVVACMVGPRPVLLWPSVLVTWTRRHRRHIVPLTLDSLIQDVSSIGAPYVIAPVLGLANFGIYRAISNVAAPVRLLIEPLRPSWARVDAQHLRRQLARACVFIAVPAGAAAALALEVIRFLPGELGVLEDLRPWSVAAGAFVTFNLIAMMFYAAARLQLSGPALFRGRVAQSSVAIVLPIAGALVGGLPGAIWAYVAATAVGSVVWVLLTRTRSASVGAPDLRHSDIDSTGV
jgi:hypothetical protein